MVSKINHECWLRCYWQLSISLEILDTLKKHGMASWQIQHVAPEWSYPSWCCSSFLDQKLLSLCSVRTRIPQHTNNPGIQHLGTLLSCNILHVRISSAMINDPTRSMLCHGFIGTAKWSSPKRRDRNTGPERMSPLPKSQRVCAIPTWNIRNGIC